ncbi:MAG: hypothetical protein IT331_24150 [Anaerolineae bacterium]|nr:hypothetical protein [Anaerolineae bacterium]
MNLIQRQRATIFFIAFLALATWSAGTAYQNGLNLLRGQGDIVTWSLFLIGAMVSGFTVLVLGRIVYVTTPKSK